LSFTRAVYSNQKIGNIIKAKRQRLNLKINSIAKILRVSNDIMIRIENGRKVLTYRETEFLSKFLDIPFNEITRIETDNLINIDSYNIFIGDTIHKAQLIFHEMLSQNLIRHLKNLISYINDIRVLNI
jgi:transcriptional regulator with XRE-family HTH domain